MNAQHHIMGYYQHTSLTVRAGKMDWKAVFTRPLPMNRFVREDEP